MGELKTCTACHENKPREDFSVDKNRSDGRRTLCKVCNAISDRWYRAHRTEDADAETWFASSSPRRKVFPLKQKFFESCPKCDLYGITMGGNPYGAKDGLIFIGLTKGRFAILNKENFGLVLHHRWFAHKNRNTYYAEAMINTPEGRTALKMHHVILNKKCLVDHKNRNGLDNRKENLREATYSLNSLNRKKQVNNTSGFANVRKHKGKWLASIRINGRNKSLGYFASPEEASVCVENIRAEALNTLRLAAADSRDGEA